MADEKQPGWFEKLTTRLQNSPPVTPGGKLGAAASAFGGLTGESIANVKNRKSRLEEQERQALGMPAPRKE